MKGINFKKGFTLLELMVVVAIVGILLALVLPRITRAMDKSRERTTHKNLKSIKLALDAYCEQPGGYFDYPETREEFSEILKKKFDEKIPKAVLRIGSNVPATNACYVASSTTSIPALAEGIEGGWVLITSGHESGNVYINTRAKDTEGEFYTTYVCW